VDARRWERVQALFHAAVAVPEADREVFLAREAGGDEALAEEVRDLLAGDAREAPLLDRGMAAVAADVLEGQSGQIPADRFGPYRLREVLGEGGMGVVYRAERKDLGSVAAIKILRDAALSPSRRERFLNEQRTLAQLQHPAIARLYDADTLPDGTPWFAMELVEGQPLTAYCRTRGTSVPGRLQLFRAVCEAVQHAHSHAVIHRDLKPSNVLVKPDGTVKLLDFGIAKHLESPAGLADQTRTGLRLMTPAYAAPEQIRGERVGTHTDVYALGVILYELLAGRLPFTLSGLSPLEALAVIAEREPERPSVVARREGMHPAGAGVLRPVSRAAWADLDVLCLTAMHKDPERRYRTADAVIRDIDHFLRGEPLEARPDTLGYRAAKFVRRNRMAVASVALVTAAVLVLSVFYAVRLTAARDAALAEAARTERIQRFTLDLFHGGDATVSPAESLRVLTLLERGVRQARALDTEPAVQAELALTLGGIYQQLGQLDRADSLFTAALDARRSMFGSAHPAVAAALVAQGLLRDARAEFDEAEQLVREGLAIARARLPADHPGVMHATTALGQVLEHRGAYADALPVVEEAVRLHQKRGDATPELAAAMSQLVNVNFYLGRYDAADSIGQRALALSRRVHGDGHPSVANDLINLGAIQFERGRYPDAERYYREALALQLAWYGDDHPATAANLTMLGRVLVQQAQLEEGAETLRRALAINERVFGPVHPRVASTVNELGIIAQQQERLDEAEAYYRRMVAIYREVYQDRHYYIGIALSNLAGVMQLRGDPAAAERLFREVLRRYAEVLPPEHQLVGVARIRLGNALLAQRRYREAIEATLDGYEILRREGASPTWLNRGRGFLAEAYEALGQTSEAARFRAELADPGG
jgi:serine/threonine protein kinase/tetratricopeptide (TPR) repeat protein